MANIDNLPVRIDVFENILDGDILDGLGLAEELSGAK